MTNDWTAAASPDQHPRRKILMSAYACGPESGSEPGAGWAIARAAAERNEVWVLTRSRFEPEITRALAADGELARWIHPLYLELAPHLEALKKRPRDVYWYYLLWQRLAGRTGLALHETTGFHVAHHVTFASDWLPCGVARVDALPLVWGPVGGATKTSLALFRWLSPRSVAGELLREAATAIARRVWGNAAARRATVILALNRDVERRFRKFGPVIVEPNSAISAATAPAAATLASEPARRPKDRTAIFVGRIVGWKGLRLAIAAIALASELRWTLDVYGEGPDIVGCTHLANKLDVGDRIRFLGQQPRTAVLEAYTRADVMLFPSIHDSAPWAVAEAVSRGCPVICLDRGGPAVLAQGHGTVVAADRHVVRGLSTALDNPPPRFEPSQRWAPERLPALVDSWYDVAQLG